MAEASDRNAMLWQNLVDAGCDEAMIRQCMNMAASNKRQDMMRLLSRHREFLLNQLHCSQKQIDCLDFLLYQMKREKI